jgi:hypothetical protein
MDCYRLLTCKTDQYTQYTPIASNTVNLSRLLLQINCHYQVKEIVLLGAEIRVCRVGSLFYILGLRGTKEIQGFKDCFFTNHEWEYISYLCSGRH